MHIQSIPYGRDNYGYLITLPDGDRAIVDPGDARPFLTALGEERERLRLILCTHYHPDHVAGLPELRQACPAAKVLAGAGDAERIDGVDESLTDLAMIPFGTRHFCAYATPCHTRGHMIYGLDDDLFTGDTLFAAGCGRFFEGGPEEMHAALNERIAQLPPATRVYAGHEYTLANLAFAQEVEPTNDAIREAFKDAARKRDAGAPTLPTSIAQELAINPFMRLHVPAVQAFCQSQEAVMVMGRLRAAKNTFRA